MAEGGHIDETIDVQTLLNRIEREARPLAQDGQVADYIPALANTPADRLGVAVCFAGGDEFVAGDSEEPFSIQSVSKVFNLAFTLDEIGEDLWRRVGREPSGMRFNSLILLEQENGIPRNPLINPGAIVVTDAMLERRTDWARAFLERMRELSENAGIQIDEEVFASEETHGDLNRAIAWYLKAKGNLHLHPDAATRAYFRHCSTAMSCRDVARAARFLIGPKEGADLCRATHRRRRIRAVMRTCGLYDAAGDFAYRVGLPAKSGVGGGIVAISPGRYSACVWSPPLDAKGNSVAGVRALEMLTHALDETS